MSFPIVAGIPLINAATTTANRLFRGLGSAAHKAVSAPAAKDSVSISPDARRAAQATTVGSAGAVAQTAASASAPQRAALTVKHQEKLAAFRDELGKMFAASGIDTQQQAVLRLDSAGNVTVINNHADKARIEELFQQRPDLAEQFRQLNAAETQLAAVPLQLRVTTA